MVQVTGPGGARPRRAAVVGLGQAGSRFDEEPGRDGVWSHVGAYLACPGMVLVGACDRDAGQRAAFRRRCPETPVFDTVDEMLGAVAPEVVSICTPSASHADLVEAVAAYPGARAVWCEKPLALTVGDAERAAGICARRGRTLVVSHVRRWLPLWQSVKAAIDDRELGGLRMLRVAMPNRLWTMGSHAVDLAVWLGGSVTEVRALAVPDLAEGGEPACPALLGFASGAYGVIEVTGRRSELVVEVEAFAADGRLAAREDRGEIMIERFGPSGSYAGYRQLGAPSVRTAETFGAFSPFTAVAREIADNLDRPDWVPTCDGASALAVQKVLAEIAAVAPINEAVA